jgi:hypothetical protein
MKFASKTKEPTLEDRISAIREECDKYIDAKAEQLKLDAPGVPIGVLRNILTARTGGCACRAVLNNLEGLNT